MSSRFSLISTAGLLSSSLRFLAMICTHCVFSHLYTVSGRLFALIISQNIAVYVLAIEMHRNLINHSSSPSVAFMRVWESCKYTQTKRNSAVFVLMWLVIIYRISHLPPSLRQTPFQLLSQGNFKPVVFKAQPADVTRRFMTRMESARSKSFSFVARNRGRSVRALPFPVFRDS